MAASKNKKRIPDLANLPKSRDVQREKDPNGFFEMKPSWSFHLSDAEEWVFNKDHAGDMFWDEILPRLKGLEVCQWKKILQDGKKRNHPIQASALTSKAQRRLQNLHIEAEAVYSLGLNGTHRIYGIIDNGVFHLIWFDTEHGDTENCVCRSHKKHT